MTASRPTLPVPRRGMRRAAAGFVRRPVGLLVPLLLAVAVTASASGGIWLYRVHPGDTLSEIAARYHTTVARLVALNRLPGKGDLIYAGSRLKIPRRARARPVVHWRTVNRHYTVRAGDSLYGISARFHTSWRVIARRNHLPRSLVVMLGQRLVIPHRVRVVTYPHKHRHDVFAGHWVPSRSTVAGMVRDVARRWGVDERLALGLSWQESGWNQRMVSSAGAIGAMQVMPFTGRFVGKYVVHRPLDLFAAHDNVTAGVALLAVLLRETDGHTARAVAGYYQGLASVRERGMFKDTKRYVANVLALRNRF